MLTESGNRLVQQRLELARKSLEKEKTKHSYLAKMYYSRWRALCEASPRKQVTTHPSKEGTETKTMPFANIQEIKREHLVESTSGKDKCIGQGTFGSCTKMFHKGVPVAVKEYNSFSNLSDVKREANILHSLKHQSFPCIFGICVTKPYLLICYFYGIYGKPYTLRRSLHSTVLHLSHQIWLAIIVNIFKAIDYLHDQHLVHRDIMISYHNNEYHPIIIDFGKCIKQSEATLKILSKEEQETYKKKHYHIAPEIISCTDTPSVASDVYSLGLIVKEIAPKVCVPSTLTALSDQCVDPLPSSRPCVSELMSTIAPMICQC